MPGGETTGSGAVEIPVHGFDDAPTLGAAELRQLLGGKGAGLVEMRRLGIPVPPGFVIGTPLCLRYLASGWPDGLDQAIDLQLAALEKATGQRFGDGEAPLLLAVRSGAPVSMPGMMDTILNLGANWQTISALGVRTQDERFALDTWSRFNRMYATTVLGVAPEALGERPSYDAPVESLRADAETVRSICAGCGTPIPDDPRTQLRAAIEAVFRSSCSQRAQVFREREGLAQDMPTAVVVQAMVFGNMGETSGTGVAFTRNPSTGQAGIYGDFLTNAQGEDVVAGVCASEPLAAMQKRLPCAFDELCRIARRLEQNYCDLCDIEFTVQQHRLQILQVRVGKRSAAAAVRIAAEMATERLITRAEAVRRVTREQLRQLLSIGKVRTDATAIAAGVAASPGVASGVICLHPDRVAALAETGQSVILLRPTTSPEDVHGMARAAGIVTSTGGMVSHAAVVARGWGIAAVCGVSGLAFEPGLSLCGHALKEGDRLTIDGGNGAIYFGNCVDGACEEPPQLQTLKHWASELGIELGCDDAQAVDAPAVAADPDTQAAANVFAVMRALSLLGFATDVRIAASLATPVEAVRCVLDALPAGHVNRTPRGLQVAGEGCAWLEAQLAAERNRTDGAAADHLYRLFMVLDERFKRLVTDWQVRVVDGREAINDHADAAYDAAVRARLSVFHAEAQPLIDGICAAAPRLRIYRTRLARAVAAISAGDGTMIASPLKDSYHTIWFELHEELIHLSGRDRATEEAKAGARGVA